ncbi:hypothetical protein [Xanthomonas arboricola]|uniref:hypothetical protein n=1 Tax=Xanthomonas arboricola TaxID=56448 RepID=UPI001E2A8682
MTGQRAMQLLGQDNPLATQSELAHFAGRNVGGWVGGTAAAYALGELGRRANGADRGRCVFLECR